MDPTQFYTKWLFYGRMQNQGPDLGNPDQIKLDPNWKFRKFVFLKSYIIINMLDLFAGQA